MKIKQLIVQLQKIKNQNALVVLASDSEGNRFSICDEVSEPDESFDEESREFLDGDTEIEGKKAIVLFPA